MKLVSLTLLVLLWAVPGWADKRADVGILLNQERAKVGRAPLARSPALDRAAQLHAEDMVAKNYFSHRGKNGSTVRTRIKKQWRRTCMWAENIAYGRSDAPGVMEMWMTSKGHKKNNLSKLPTHYGVGYDDRKDMWVLVFAKGC